MTEDDYRFHIMTTIKYIISSRPSTYTTGSTSDGLQAIIGPFHYPWIITVFFDREGRFMNVERRMTEDIVGSKYCDSATDQQYILSAVTAWKSEMAFAEHPIAVAQFFLEEYPIGIQSLPIDLADFLSDPSAYSHEDQIEFLKDIEEWKDEGNFVFYWSENYHLDRHGESI